MFQPDSHSGTIPAVSLLTYSSTLAFHTLRKVCSLKVFSPLPPLWLSGIWYTSPNPCLKIGSCLRPAVGNTTQCPFSSSTSDGPSQVPWTIYLPPETCIHLRSIYKMLGTHQSAKQTSLQQDAYILGTHLLPKDWCFPREPLLFATHTFS